MIDPRDAEQRTVAPDGRPPEEQPAWRNDFPIDWPQDQYVSRREFTKFMVLTSLAFVVGQVWLCVQSLFRRNRPKPGRQRLAALADVAVGGVVLFRYPSENDTCLLLRLPDGPDGKPRLVAYDQRCTHLSCGVLPQLRDESGGLRPIEDCRLHCPCHHGYFDAETGRPLAGPPRRPLLLVELDIKGGIVYAKGIKERTV